MQLPHHLKLSTWSPTYLLRFRRWALKGVWFPFTVSYTRMLTYATDLSVVGRSVAQRVIPLISIRPFTPPGHAALLAART
jgi:hypothetical protein